MTLHRRTSVMYITPSTTSGVVPARPSSASWCDRSSHLTRTLPSTGRVDLVETGIAAALVVARIHQPVVWLGLGIQQALGGDQV